MILRTMPNKQPRLVRPEQKGMGPWGKCVLHTQGLGILLCILNKRPALISCGIHQENCMLRKKDAIYFCTVAGELEL